MKTITGYRVRWQDNVEGDNWQLTFRGDSALIAAKMFMRWLQVGKFYRLVKK